MQQLPIQQASWADVAAHITASSLSENTKKDYLAALMRGRRLKHQNRLEDIPVDFAGFLREFPYNGFDPSTFRTEDAYRAWRRKVGAALKRFLGTLRHKNQGTTICDAWSDLLDRAEEIVTQSEVWTRPDLIPVRILANVGRSQGYLPQDMSPGKLDDLVATSIPDEGRSIAKASKVLSELRSACPEIAASLHPDFATVTRAARRIPLTPSTSLLLAEVEAWVEEYCDGEMDEVMESPENEKKAATRSTYLAACRGYFAIADDRGLLSEAATPAEAFAKPVFNAVLRSWIECDKPTLQVSSRTLYQYVSNLKTIAARNGVDTSAMSKALRTTRALKQGKKSAGVMGADAQKFCAWLLGSRKAELLYRSLHIRFQERSKAILEEKDQTLDDIGHMHAIQLGTLAAAAAIEIWGPPLRIENLLDLKLYGDSPNLLMPEGHRKFARFLIPEDKVKNRRALEQNLHPGANRALDVLTWYIRDIRPHYPGADASPYLFPGHVGPTQPISKAALRNWLSRHGRALGIRIKPHWFRHAVVSLYLREHPGKYDHVARLLGDTPNTVKNHYAWIDDAALLEEIQREILKFGGFS